MGLAGLVNLDGSLSPRAMDYYIERARGGAGLILTGLFNSSCSLDTLFPSQYTFATKRRVLIRIQEGAKMIPLKNASMLAFAAGTLCKSG